MSDGDGLGTKAIHGFTHPLDELRRRHQLVPENHDASKPFRFVSNTAIAAMLEAGTIRYRVDENLAVEMPVNEALLGTCWHGKPANSIPRYAPVYAVLAHKFDGKLPIMWLPDGTRRVRCKHGPLLVYDRQATLLDALALPVSVFSTPYTRPPRRRASAGGHRTRHHARDV